MCNHAVRQLRKLVLTHSALKTYVVDEIEQFLGRKNLTTQAQYVHIGYAIKREKVFQPCFLESNELDNARLSFGQQTATDIFFFFQACFIVQFTYHTFQTSIS